MRPSLARRPDCVACQALQSTLGAVPPLHPAAAAHTPVQERPLLQFKVVQVVQRVQVEPVVPAAALSPPSISLGGYVVVLRVRVTPAAPWPAG